MFRAMKVHHQEFSCRMQALWYNVLSKLSSYLYRASMTIKTLYYPTDAQIYNL